MPLPIRQQTPALEDNLKKIPKNALQTNTSFINIPNDVLPVFYNNLNLKQIINMCSLNKSFNSIELELQLFFFSEIR